MANPEVTGRKISTGSVVEADAYSVEEFCQRHSISVSLFYKLKAQGLGPALFYAGTRPLISKEAAAAWRQQREAANRMQIMKEITSR